MNFATEQAHVSLPEGDVSSRFPRAWCELMAYLRAPTAAVNEIAPLQAAPTQSELIGIAKLLRHLRTGWTMILRRDYFRWFAFAASHPGSDYQRFLHEIKRDSLSGLSEDQQQRLADIIDAKPDFASPTVGPDLTGVAARFVPRELLEAIIEPSKVISDQYGSLVIALDSRMLIHGRIVEHGDDRVEVNTDMFEPDQRIMVHRRSIAAIKPASISTMPTGLIDRLKEDEIIDLLTYLLAGRK